MSRLSERADIVEILWEVLVHIKYSKSLYLYVDCPLLVLRRHQSAYFVVEIHFGLDCPA